MRAFRSLSFVPDAPFPNARRMPIIPTMAKELLFSGFWGRQQHRCGFRSGPSDTVVCRKGRSLNLSPARDTGVISGGADLPHGHDVW